MYPSIRRLTSLSLSCIVCSLAVCNVAAQTINELHPTPAAGEPEWIELVNSTNRPINLSGWYVCDSRSCCVLDNVRLAGSAYLILTRDSAALREARPLPTDVVLVEVALPSLNNTTDVVYMRNSDSTLVDSVAYTMAWGRKGLSLERAPSSYGAEAAWSASLSSDSATCGYLNSVVRLGHDVRIADVCAGRGTVDVVFVNHGIGASAVRRASLVVQDSDAGPGLDAGPDSDAGQSNVSGILYDEVPRLAPTGDYIWHIPVETLRSMHPRLDVRLTVVIEGEDDRVENDTLRRHLTLPPIINTVTITEVMFDPFDTQCDYIEVYNGSADTIDLNEWYVLDGEFEITADGRDNRPRATVEGLLVLRPNEYGVLLMDTLQASMIHTSDKKRSHICKHGINANADGDALALCTRSGFLVDSIRYHADMHIEALASTKGVALEKREPRLTGLAPASWTSSGNLKGGTPARQNSVLIDVPVTTSISALPNPFSSDPADSRHPTVIAFKQPFMHAIVGLSILTPGGQHVRWLLNAGFAGSDGVVVWDGADDMGRRLPVGQYVAVLQAADASSTRVHHDAYVIILGH